ncbi:transcriptional regulator family: Fungal Specific TF [Penicillium lividum]|nr:transcriptional regulator family: Fungal Specific TF [Penicillium lividum]
MTTKKHTPPARRKGGIHFVNARPTTEHERITLQRFVRNHVGRWISEQTRRRSNANLRTIRAQRPSDLNSHFVTLVSHPSPHPPLYRTAPASDHALPSAENIGSTWKPAPTTIAPKRECYEESDGAVAILPPSTSAPFNENLWPNRPVSGHLDPFATYPDQVGVSPDVLNELTKYCLDYMWPGVTTRKGGLSSQGGTLALFSPQMSWFELSRSDPTLFTAFMYGSLCHQRVMLANERLPSYWSVNQQRLLEMYEAQSITLITQAVWDESRAFTDAVLLSVVCMAHHAVPTEAIIRKTPFDPPFQWLQWLDIYGCLSPNPTHINGLVDLIKMRGGLKNIKLPGLAATLCFSEVFAASIWRVPPIFGFWPLDASRVGKSLQELLGFGPSDIERGFGRLQVIGFTSEMAEAFQAARAYTDIIKKIERGHTNSSGDYLDQSLLADQRNFTQYTLLTLLPSDAITFYFTHENQSGNYEACRLAALIFGAGVIFPIPAQNSPLKDLAKQLRIAITHPTAFSLWTSQTTLSPLIWALTLGGIAAFESPDRSFFVSSLAYVARRSDIRSWSGIRPVLDGMLWHEGASDRAGRDLWREVEPQLDQNPVEIDGSPVFRTR